MNIVTDILLIMGAYALGSVPSAVWIGKLFYKIDVREFGSGNAGATNTFRVLGKKAGIPVLLLDILKGVLAVSLAFLSRYTDYSTPFVNYQVALGAAAVLGHIFPLFAGFRGGKGVATLLGVAIAMQPACAGMALVVFLIMLALFRYVSLSSMSAGLAFPVILLTTVHHPAVSQIIFSLLVASLLIITHKKNIQRLLKKQEPKLTLKKVKVKTGR